MSHNSRLSPANPTNKDIYWFAQGGDISSSVEHNNNEESSESKEVTSPVSQKEREDRIRQFREHQEEERRRRLGELQYATIQAQKYREQLEEERRRKIEDLRVKELERRQAVEERKRMIYEAEQERKEAILKRNLDREARIEARRNAQRNSMSFAFGSSTPRTFDLDLVALGSGRLSSQSTVVFSSASNRHLDDRDLESKKYVGANGLDRKPGDDPMSRSMISLSSASRARKKTDLMPVMPRDYVTSRNRSPGNHGKRAVSMTRLDQLAQPRHRYTEASKESAVNTSNTIPADGPRTISPSMSKSMCNIPNSLISIQSNKHSLNTNNKYDNGMSKSMLHLASSSQKTSKFHFTSPYPFSCTPSPSQRLPNKHFSQSMTHLAITPRPTRASRLRAEGLMSIRKEGQASSILVLDRTTGSESGRLALSAVSPKDAPSRPRSSMSATSEQSVTSSQASVTSVKMRNRPRRSRPVSMGCVPSQLNQQQLRQGRSTERKAITPTSRHSRAKSVEHSEEKSRTPVIRKPAASQKSPKVIGKANNNSPVEVDETKISDSVIEPNTTLESNLKTDEEQNVETNEESSDVNITNSTAITKQPRIISEEAAKAALAEKRKLAREQAEREAELEQQRQEELRRQEEERKRQEEEIQKKFEEEQIRLAEIHRLQEEEKLRKAIEQQEQREREEREKQQEELKLREEKEEQERKAKEEAEKQRQELEERLRREEAERAERKRRVEQIMSRTRKATSTPPHGTSQTDGKLSSPEDEEKPLPASNEEITVNKSEEATSESSAQSSIAYDAIDAFVSSDKSTTAINGRVHIEDYKQDWNPFAEQSYSQENNLLNEGLSHSTEHDIKENQNLLKASDSGVILADHSPDRTVKFENNIQPNGYSHHEDDRSFTDSISPEEKSETSVGVLLDFGAISSSSVSQNVDLQPLTEYEQLIDIGAEMKNQNDINIMNKTDEVNRVPGNPFIAFEEPVTWKHDNSLTDLLS